VPAGQSHPVPDDHLGAVERPGRRVQRDPGAPGELPSGTRDGQVDQVRDGVRQPQELERGLVRHDRPGCEAKPGGEEPFTRRGGVVAEAVQTSSNTDEAAALRMMGEQGGAEAAVAGLGGGEIARLLGCDGEEAFVVRA